MSEFPYDLSNPQKVIELPEILNEISGLEYIDSKTIACVQDEDAKIFLLNLKSGKIKQVIKFGKTGDFEGIARVGDKFYVLRSDGEIIRVSDKGVVKKFSFKKNKKFDFEGLCYDSSNNRLLVVCKTHGKSKNNNFVFVYGFSLDSKKYLKKPVFKIDKKELGDKFQASGVAIDGNGSIYIPSAYSRRLLKLTNSGEICKVFKLKHKHFNQAEGICFGNGNLIISNEKGSGIPNVMVFNALN